MGGGWVSGWCGLGLIEGRGGREGDMGGGVVYRQHVSTRVWLGGLLRAGNREGDREEEEEGG